jgi:mono/diheme cytochrome c family protein
LSRLSLLRQVAAFVSITLLSTGCWEQWSLTWWPQMKWQAAVQPFEETGQPSAPAGFVPPDGTVPVGAVRKTSDMPLAETETLQNPRPVSLAGLENGKRNFEVFCGPCHGKTGLGDGPIAGPPFGKGPFLGVLPVAGPVGSQITKNFSDGHIYTVISQGVRRMPNYRRIPPNDRWDIVNYVRYLNGQGLAPAQTAQAPAPQQGAQP